MKKLYVYYTPRHASISVTHDDGVTRETSSDNMATTVCQLTDEERQVMERFALGILECLNGDIKRLRDW